jgi:hypothetical protein
MLSGINRDYWVAMGLLGLLAILLALVVREYGVGLPEFPTAPGRAEPVVPPLSADQFARLFLPERVKDASQDSELRSPFFTTHFQPPKPKPPTTRKVEMTYLGLLESAAGQRRVFLRVDNETRIVNPGESIIADRAVAEVDLRTLSLTNNTPDAILLPFNVSKAVEVPIP